MLILCTRSTCPRDQEKRSSKTYLYVLVKGWTELESQNEPSYNDSTVLHHCTKRGTWTLQTVNSRSTWWIDYVRSSAGVRNSQTKSQIFVMSKKILLTLYKLKRKQKFWIISLEVELLTVSACIRSFFLFKYPDLSLSHCLNDTRNEKRTHK